MHWGPLWGRQGYVRHTAGLDHRRCFPNHWAAEGSRFIRTDTHGDKSDSPAARNELLHNLSAQVCLPSYFSNASMAACAMASSTSDAAPLAAMAPIVSLSILMGSPP